MAKGNKSENRLLLYVLAEDKNRNIAYEKQQHSAGVNIILALVYFDLALNFRMKLAGWELLAGRKGVRGTWVHDVLPVNVF